MIPIKENISSQRQAELAILALMKKPKKMYFLSALQVIFFDESGQVDDEVIDTIDISLRKVQNSKIYILEKY